MVNVWIFRNNSKKSSLTIDLHVSEPKGNWSVRQNDKEIGKGDIVLFWISGKNRGIYSIAEILDKPKLIEVDPTLPWVTTKSSKEKNPKEIMVDYGGLRKLEPQILESELIKIPELSNLLINLTKFPFRLRTNFPVSEAEWNILSKVIEKRTQKKSDEILNGPEYFTEGKEKEIIQTIYERNPKLREMAIKIHGTTCSACGFNFAKKYGKLGEGYIEIHHLVPQSEHKIKGESEINPETDLMPLCSNCHRMIHKSEKMLSIEELKKIVKS